MLDRNNCPMMWVWGQNERNKKARIVIDILPSGDGCVAIMGKKTEDFYSGRFYYIQPWANFRTITIDELEEL